MYALTHQINVFVRLSLMRIDNGLLSVYLSRAMIFNEGEEWQSIRATCTTLFTCSQHDT